MAISNLRDAVDAQVRRATGEGLDEYLARKRAEQLAYARIASDLRIDTGDQVRISDSTARRWVLDLDEPAGAAA